MEYNGIQEYNEADPGDFVSPHIKKTDDGWERVRKESVLNGEAAKEMIHHLHRTAVDDYDLEHQDAADIYNEAQHEGGFMGHYPHIRQDSFEDTIEEALESYDSGYTEQEVVDDFQLAVDTSPGGVPGRWEKLMSR